jgi:hypothetical protein
MPIEQPVRWEFVINRKAARAQGWGIPDGIMVRADEVIER